MNEMPQLAEPWWRPSDQQAQALCREALLEIGPGHELAGRGLITVAVCEGCDDVLFELDDGTFAMVHLTWRGRQEPSRWPTTRRMESVQELRQVASDHHH